MVVDDITYRGVLSAAGAIVVVAAADAMIAFFVFRL
jgi:hypothetical protein